MLSRLLIAAALTVATSAAQAQTPAPANPLQARRSPPAAAQAPATAPATTAPATTATAPAEKPKSAGAQRRTQCSQEYQAAKAANKLNGQKWPQFYSACNKRLKGAA